MRLKAVVITLLLAPRLAAQVVDLEDIALPPAGFNNGATAAGAFLSRGASFNNVYAPAFGTWGGWAISRTTDVATPGYTNQYSAFAVPAGGGFASPQFAVGYVDAFTPVTPAIALPAGTRPLSVRLTNTTYTALSMRDGDGFAKKFGGPSGNDPDFLKLTITGLDAANHTTGSLDFFLADYRFANNALDYIVNAWTQVDLSALGLARSLQFTLASSDNGAFGMNTPAYFALDQLTLGTIPVPEPGSFVCLALAGLGWAGCRFPRRARSVEWRRTREEDRRCDARCSNPRSTGRR